jgi:glucose/arabinose dehydrogenase
MSGQIEKKVLLVIVGIATLLFLEGVFRGSVFRSFFRPTSTDVPDGLSLKDVSTTGNEKSSDSLTPKIDVQTIATGLEIPWDIAYLPGGDMLVTERGGKLLKIGNVTKTVTTISGVVHKGEGGLLGIALHPDFESNKFIYLYFTTRVQDGTLQNRIERYRFENDTLSGKTTILEGIKGASSHDGGRIAFGPDGLLYVAVGDAENRNDAQDKNSLNGKILRITDSGEAAPGNPFGNKVYSFGHRNPQGLAWDDNKRLWITEHGPSGSASGNDEVNLIVPGANYGWPDFVGEKKGDGITSPVLESGKSDTWAPASLLHYKNSLFFGGLRGEALYQVKLLENDKTELVSHFKGEFGRIRTVSLGPDGYFYLTTSNRDGRGNVGEGDDRIIKVNPEIFFR